MCRQQNLLQAKRDLVTWLLLPAHALPYPLFKLWPVCIGFIARHPVYEDLDGILQEPSLLEDLHGMPKHGQVHALLVDQCLQLCHILVVVIEALKYLGLEVRVSVVIAVVLILLLYGF